MNRPSEMGCRGRDREPRDQEMQNQYFCGLGRGIVESPQGLSDIKIPLEMGCRPRGQGKRSVF